MTFSPATLHTQLQALPPTRGYRVAYSGGMDSHVLLHALAALRDELGIFVGAVHVNHGLQPHATEWQEHCAAVCRELDVEYTPLIVDARAAAGESPEAAARRARYTALAEWLPAQHGLLSAHHQDDQAETLLVQLLRGSGVHGLAAMPAQSVLGQGLHLRPLLDCPRRELQAYADAEGLNWVEDPTNRDVGFTRNFLRHRVMPELQRRWPVISASLARSAAHQAEAASLLDELAAADLAGLDDTLSCQQLKALSAERQRNALRFWLRQQTGGSPSSAVLARIQHDLLYSRPDAEPCVRWGSFELRRYRERLFVLQQLPAPLPGPQLDWALQSPLSIPQAGGVLSVTRCVGQGVRESAAGAGGVQVGWRQGGECCVPAGRGHRHSLKKLFQEQGIPPWQRARTPLIYINGQLAAVAGLWVCEPFQAGPGEAGLLIDWQPVAPTAQKQPD